MKDFLDFYNGLDALNLIIFWGIVIVVILIIVFAILLLCKKKKGNDETIEENMEEQPEEIIPTIDEPKEDQIIAEEIPKEEPEETKEVPIETPSPLIEEEKNFVAEEHVIEYNNDLFNIPNLKKNNPEELKAEKQEPDIYIRTEPFDMPKKPYEKNVLRQMSLSQTSPIGLTIPKNEPPKEEELPPLVDRLSDELQENKYLIQEDDEEIPVVSQDIINEITKEEPLEEKEEIVLPEEEPEEKMFDLPIIEHFENNEEDMEEQPEIIPEEEPIKESNEQYLEEVSRKLSEAEIPEEIPRTEYEKKQEEDAIISYKELMEKKDSIETVDEEDAVISIDELIQRKKEEDKLYNITENEETDDFINELKKFRSDL